MSGDNDQVLLRRYLTERAEQAFSELVWRHLPMVYGAALRRTDGRRDIAADVAQETFIQLARDASRLERHPALAGWLYCTARNIAATTMRSERARKHREVAQTSDVDVPTPIAALEWAEIRPRLEELIEQLDEQSRDAVVRRFFSGQRFADIGAGLKISEDAARMRVDRALSRLREQLVRKKIDCSASALTALLVATPSGAVVPSGLAANIIRAGKIAAMHTEGTSTLIQMLGSGKTAGLTFVVAGLLFVAGLNLSRKAADTEALYSTILARETARLDASPPATVSRSSLTQGSSGNTQVPNAAPFVPVPMTAEEFRAVRDRWRAISPNVVRDTTIIGNRIRVRLRFHALYAALAMNPKQIAQFEARAAEKHLTFSPLIGSPEERDAHRLANIPRTEAVVRESLGPQYVPAFHAYIATSDLRLIADELAENTYFTDTPLTSTQADLLVQSCVENCGPRSVATFIDPDTVNWPAVLRHANGFLSAAQVRALEAALARMAFDLEFKRVTGLPLRVPVRGL